MMNQEAKQLTLLEQIIIALKEHPIAFNSFNVFSEEIIINILDHK